jgi:hypothetical protein
MKLGVKWKFVLGSIIRVIFIIVLEDYYKK